MPENNQVSDKTKPEATGSSSTQPGSQAIDMNHTNVIVPHRISNHDKLVQTMVMVDGEWVNVNDTNDQKNVQEDMHKVNRVVTEAQKDIINAQNAADSAVKSADSAISASKVNSDAIAAQGEAISEAKIALDSAAASIRADVAKVQSEVNTAKTANETEAKSIRDDLKMANSSIATVKDHLGNVSSELDTYAKSAAAQEHDITIIRQKQGQFEVDYAGTKGDVNQIKANIKGLSENLKNSEGDVASLQVTAKKLQSSMSDAEGNISNLQVTAKSYDKIFEDHLGRISKVEQTASKLTNEFSDQQGHLNRVEQTAQGTQQTVANQQGQINNIKTDAAGMHQTITGQGNQIANINVTLGGLSTKYEDVSGDLSKLKDSNQWKIVTGAFDANQYTQTAHIFYQDMQAKNTPDPGWFYFLVEAPRNDRVTQTLIKDNSENSWSRFYNGTWSAWAKGATQLDIDSLSDKITTNSTAIDQNNKRISLKADQTTVDKIKNTATQNSSRLDVMAGQISSKVTATDVNNIVDSKGYTTTSTVQSLITQKAGTINESITNLTNSFNSLQVGGRNYLRDSDKSITGWGQDLGTIPNEVLNELAGKTITVSCDVEWSGYAHDNSRQNRLGFEASVTGSDGHNYWFGAWVHPSTDSGKERVSAQYTLPAGVTFAVNNNGHNGYVDINGSGKVSHVKIEVGTKATDWTPASEDMATVTQVQSLTESIDGLQSTVANKADKSQVTQLSNVIQSKVSTNDFTSKVSQLSTDINARVTKGDLLSQINIEAGRTLIQSNKIYFDADSFVMSANSKAFIPSAYITNINADKITTGTLDASKIYVKNFSAGMISGGVLKGVFLKSGSDDRFFQTSSDNIYWSRTGEYGDAIIGTDRYLGNGDYQGLVVADDNYVMLANWGGSSYENGKFNDNVGLIGWPRIVLDYRGYWNSDVGEFADGHGNTIISSWISKKEYLNVEEHKGVFARLDDSNSDSQFRIQKDDHIGAYFGEGDNGNQINFNLGGDGCGFNVNGPLHVTGSKNSIVETRQGYLAINAYETAEYYFGDIGENNTGDTSQVVIGIDRIFNEVVNTDIQYQVFVTPYSNAHVWVEKRYNNRFIVKSDRSNAEFGWELKAKRKGYESNRLRRVNVDFNQMDLKGEN